MRYNRSRAVAVYLLLSLVWIYWISDQQLFYGSDVGFAVACTVVALVNLLLAAAVGRWWVLALPLLQVVVALPAGYPNDLRGEPLPIWFALLVFWVPIEILALSLGTLATRMLSERRVRPLG